MSAHQITDELVARVAADLRERYALDDDDLRSLGARLAADDREARSRENRAFAERFTEGHRETFDRLGQ